MENGNNSIEKLTLEINSASAATSEGRSLIVKCCKKLYNLIEENVYKAGKEWMLQGMYNDLCNGNFSEPFYCERKKGEFNTVVEVYNTQIIPNI